MSSCTRLFRFALLAAILLVFVPGVSGWTLSSWSVTPNLPELPPGTPVTAVYVLHFDSWATGSTFEQGNSLTMSTDLANPQWVVKKIETLDDQPPIIEQVPVRQSEQVRLDSWTLSYTGKRFDINVQLTGTTPSLNQSQNISVVKLQERTSGAKVVGGSMINKGIHLLVPAQEPTIAQSAPTNEVTPAVIIENTLMPQAQAPAQETITKKVTYSPGPDPLYIAGLLAGLVCVMAVLRRK